MSCHTPLYSWTGQVVSGAFPHIFPATGDGGRTLQFRCDPGSAVRSEQRCHGLGVFAGRGLLDDAPRLQEFYQPASAESGARRELDVTTCFAPLLAWTLKGWPSKRLALALDATSLGERFTVLSISVVYRGSACPVAWKIVQANVRHAWKPEWITLLRLFQTLVPADWTVIASMSDRGLYARWLFQEISCRSGLASLDANHPQRQVPQERVAVERYGHSIRGEDRGAMARTWCGLPQDGSATARLRRPSVPAGNPATTNHGSFSRLGAGPRATACGTGCGLGSNRGSSCSNTAAWATADDPDDRPRPRGAVAGAGRRHPLRAGRRWGSRRWLRDTEAETLVLATPDRANHARCCANRWPIGSNADPHLLHAPQLRSESPRSEPRGPNNAW